MLIDGWWLIPAGTTVSAFLWWIFVFPEASLWVIVSASLFWWGVSAFLEWWF